jgi:hypothetical protein
MSSPEFIEIMERLERIERRLPAPVVAGEWVNEDEAMRITGLGKNALYKRRKDNTFKWATEKGRKIKYWLPDLENSINNNSSRS